MDKVKIEVRDIDEFLLEELKKIAQKMVDGLNDMGCDWEHGKELAGYIENAVATWADEYGYSEDTEEGALLLFCVIRLISSHTNYRDKSKDQ